MQMCKNSINWKRIQIINHTKQGKPGIYVYFCTRNAAYPTYNHAAQPAVYAWQGTDRQQ